MGDKGNEKSWFSHILRSFTSLLCGKDVKTSNKASVASGPEASMVAAAKHFSSAHKVKFN
ncbi:unnamed protein product [Lupinus luteus]|uniref:Uncharacterized protein n=1 Tax=Lupinus luteus TaxID=3873 RepID=A0AAV1WFR7_LUPLU